MIRNKSYVQNPFVLALLVILSLLTLRWLIIEPYVIPSESMAPTLLVNDYILVQKYSYGVRLPFSQNWFYGPSSPQRGDVVVFKKPGEEYYAVKRVMGLSEDIITLDSSGRLKLNGKLMVRHKTSFSAPPFLSVSEQDMQISEDMVHVFENKIKGKRFRTILKKNLSRESSEFRVPKGHIFLMGDNRDSSLDSRFWGSLPLNYLVGKVIFLWMSCEAQDAVVGDYCLPSAVRWPRLGGIR